jgi:hypothetical protein
MRAITSKAKLLKKLQKNDLVTNGIEFYLSDLHKSSVGRAVANKIIGEGLVEVTDRPSWFEHSYRLIKK